MTKHDTLSLSDTLASSSMDWDLAFHRWDVKTNGGLSGLGRGAARILSTDTWQKDTLILTYMSIPDMNGGPDQRLAVGANILLGTYMTVGMSQIPPTYTLNKQIFEIKAADGTLYHIRFDAFLNDSAVKGFVKFSYQQE